MAGIKLGKSSTPSISPFSSRRRPKKKLSWTGLGAFYGVAEKSLRPFHLPDETSGVQVPPLRLWPKPLTAIWPSFRNQWSNYDPLCHVVAAFFIASGKPEADWMTMTSEEIRPVVLAMQSVLFSGSDSRDAVLPIVKRLYANGGTSEEALVAVMREKIQAQAD